MMIMLHQQINVAACTTAMAASAPTAGGEQKNLCTAFSICPSFHSMTMRTGDSPGGDALVAASTTAAAPSAGGEQKNSRTALSGPRPTMRLLR